LMLPQALRPHAESVTAKTVARLWGLIGISGFAT
jgi:hypothetical protein